MPAKKLFCIGNPLLDISAGERCAHQCSRARGFPGTPRGAAPALSQKSRTAISKVE
jgi:hypothetical protein